MDEGVFFVLCCLFIVVGILCSKPRRKLPDPDRSTLRRPVVDPFWQVGVGYERHTRHERRVGDRRC
jgi:hypothetical protein